MNKVVVIIPARYASRRFPGKPLIPINNLPLIAHVLQRAGEIPGVEQVLVATDDERIAGTVRNYNGRAVMTPADLASGSDRAGWVARDLDCDIVVNLQGDEPVVDTGAVGKAIRYLAENKDCQVVTLGYSMESEHVWKNPNVVKVVTDQNGRALYFSRQPVPCFRDGSFHKLAVLYQHLGVYIYRRNFLLKFLSWEPSELEKIEKLEQLRILSAGYSMQLIEANLPSIGVDTPEDVEKVEKFLSGKG